MTTAAVTVADLRAIDLFDDLGDDELEQWVPVAHARETGPGEVLAEQGEEAPGVVLLFEGEAEAYLVDQGRLEPVGRQRGPTWTLAISVLTGGPLGIRLQTETACRLALVEPEDFRRLAFAQPVVHQRVMRQVAPVIGRITAIEQSRERLTSLGTMAAGLAHELNNPAAAARRSATALAEAIDVVSSTIPHLRRVRNGAGRSRAARRTTRGGARRRGEAHGPRRARRGRRRGRAARASGGARGP